MKNIFIWLSLVLLGLTACISTEESDSLLDEDNGYSSDSSDVATAIIPSLVPTEVPAAEPQLSFESQTYFDEEGRFELQYPIGWNEGFGERHSRGYFRQLVSWDISESNSIEFRPPDGTYAQITVYSWEPLNDLDAYIAQRMPSWESSEWEVVDLEELQIAGNDAVKFTLESPNAEAPVFLFWLVLGARYLELSGMGDFSILNEMVQSINILGVEE